MKGVRVMDKPRPWTAEDEQILVEMRAAGANWRETANKLNHHLHGVTHCLSYQSALGILTTNFVAIDRRCHRVDVFQWPGLTTS
jgi:hypothetical protein